MKALIFSACLLFTLHAQSLPVVPMKSPDLDQLVRNLRDKKLTPTSDCNALDLLECFPADPTRLTDLSMRWVQLDEDPELEAILTVQAPAENWYSGYVFDKQRTWNMVGSFFDKGDWRTRPTLIEANKLTYNSPVMVLVNLNLGGSGSVLLRTQVFHLRAGKLWRVMEIRGMDAMYLPPPEGVLRQHVFSTWSDRLVILTISEEPPGHIIKNECEVRRWDAIKHTFVAIPNEKNEYCNPKTGKPIEDKSFWSGVPIYP